jgi:DNA-binding NtrC family response regulator
MKKVSTRIDASESTIAAPLRMEVIQGTIYPTARATARVSVGSEPVIIGRHDSSQLMLEDPRVSSVHAEVVATSDGVRLRDMGSKNGTFLGGVRVGEVFLTARTIFRVGVTELVFEPAASEFIPLSQYAAFGPLVGDNAQMRALFSRLARIAATDLTVLIGGETGTGKEVVARAIHEGSPRAQGPFVVVDCGSIPASLAEATLFGHEKGAFTGAIDKRISPFVEADGGTIFLDELGELPVDLQPKLLRALAERRIKAVGGSSYRPVNVRVLAATRRDLAREVNDGMFRSDLFFRVAEVRIDLPPLRARVDDVPVLVRHILGELGAPEAFTRLTDEGVTRLQRYDWPGNVRELRNAVAVALALSDGGALDIGAHLGALSVRGAPSHSAPPQTNVTFRDAKQDALGRFERDYFAALFQETNGNISEIARRADVERAHVRMYLRRHGLVAEK